MHQCRLLNSDDQITFSRRHQHAISESIIDLTFINQDNVMNWAIDQQASTGSDHEVIRFEIIAKENLTIYATATAMKYNIKKAD